MQYNNFRSKLNLLIVNLDNKNLYKSYYNFFKIKINENKYLSMFINLTLVLFYSFYLSVNDFKQINFYLSLNLFYDQ